MKHLWNLARRSTQAGASGNPGRGSASLATITVLALGSALLCSFSGDAPTAPNSGSTDAFSGGGSGDETVGTLPTFDGGPVLDIQRNGRIVRPSLYVQGPVDAVLSAVVDLRGDERVLAQPMPAGELRLVFLGTAQVTFDRNAFASSALDVGVAVPANAVVQRSGAFWNGQNLPWWTYVYELPVAEFTQSGLLDQAPVVAGLQTSAGSTLVRAQSNPDFVTLVQRR
jgi:hypothetical protein